MAWELIMFDMDRELEPFFAHGRRGFSCNHGIGSEPLVPELTRSVGIKLNR
jgi:hypothetical protein